MAGPITGAMEVPMPGSMVGTMTRPIPKARPRLRAVARERTPTRTRTRTEEDKSDVQGKGNDNGKATADIRGGAIPRPKARVRFKTGQVLGEGSRLVKRIWARGVTILSSLPCQLEF